MSVVDDIATYLSSLGTVGVYTPASAGGTIFTYTVPPAPLSLLAVLFTPVQGMTGPYIFDDTLPQWETLTVQIQTRDPDATTAYARVYAAYLALAALSDVSLGGKHYFLVRPLSPGLLPRQDDNNCFLGICNVRCQVGLT